ncbi:ABC transporter ATP-binding protein [Brevibacillus choshinensis]|uniref:ABC transporter ATP-binding protein n=1 Tax=Brevibacillus choshinensis TaxID=54911 RepID=A0ABX7FTH4_BRECH|nr:ABC transporter ATP-binding protein [Brevibacillus choshinensis]QRG69541.1 ABC transporter ATP-binding protein [Brevibacillus choshinensis]
MKLAAKDISISLGNEQIIHDICLEVKAGEFVGLIGPNGSGKSTLLKSIYRVLKPVAGRIFLDGDDLYQLAPRESARRMAVVRQESSVEFDFTVLEMVLMGRSPHKGMFQMDTPEDMHIGKEALARVGMTDYSERSFFSLSGGEKKRVLIARALAQQAELLVLDEPTNHLDVRYQLQVMDLVKQLGIPVLSALHDLNLAAMYCDRLYVLKAGRIVASGCPDEILTADLIREVYEVETDVSIHPVTGKKHIYFFSSFGVT